MGAAGSLSPAALAVVLLVALPKWSRALSRAVKLLGMLGAVVAGYLALQDPGCSWGRRVGRRIGVEASRR